MTAATIPRRAAMLIKDDEEGGRPGTQEVAMYRTAKTPTMQTEWPLKLSCADYLPSWAKRLSKKKPFFSSATVFGRGTPGRTSSRPRR